MKTDCGPRPARTPRRGLGPRSVPFLVLLCVALPGVGLAHGGFTGAITNKADAAGTGSLQLAAFSGATQLCATSTAVSAATCSGTMVSNALAGGVSTQSQATRVTEPGSLTATTTTLQQGVCGPIPLANAVTVSDPQLIRGGVTDAAAGSSPFPDGSGITLDGSTGYTAQTTVNSTPPQNFTEVVWFKTAGTAGGVLMGYSGSPAVAAPNNWDRMLWLDNAGKVVFGVYAGATKLVTSPAAYNDGTWHLAAASISAAGQVLYVDGSKVASAKAVTTAEPSTGYWHLGWENVLSGWPDPPTVPFFAGSLTDAAIFPVLSAGQVTTLSTATTQATWNADVAGGNGVTAATSAWQLGDQPTGVYTGTPSWYTASPCALVDATIATTGASTTCAAPALPTPCVAPTSGVTLKSLAGLAVAIPSPTSAQPVTVTVTTARDVTATTLTNPNLAGLHLNFGEAVTSTAGSFTAALSWPTTQNIVL